MNINKLIDILKHPKEIPVKINYRYPTLLKWMSDEQCIRFWYFYTFGKKLDLKNPKTFNEKLQWLKLNDRKSFYTDMVDKYKAKQYVANIIGEEYIIPTLGVWDSFEDIDFDALPEKFVLKCTHDSGGLVICRDKSKFNKQAARKKINRSLKRNFYWVWREWPYKNIKPRIIAEQYMSDNSGYELEDYKVHNFNGIPEMILVCRDRFREVGLSEDFFSSKWEHLDISRPYHPNAKAVESKPKALQQMLQIAEKLSQNVPFVRTDFYLVNDNIYFGEMTFYPAGGFERFVPESADYDIGEWLKPTGGVYLKS